MLNAQFYVAFMHFFYYLSIKYHNHSHFSIRFYAFLLFFPLNLSKFHQFFCNYAYSFHAIKKMFHITLFYIWFFMFLCIFIKITDHQSFVYSTFGGRHTHFHSNAISMNLIYRIICVPLDVRIFLLIVKLCDR